jgi:hypothetical protein
MDRTLEFLLELTRAVNCRGLAFLKRPDIVDYLSAQERGRLPAAA